MKITSRCVVALTWTLKDTLGEVLDELDEPVEFLVGGSDLLAKIEESLLGHQAGDRLELHLEPEQAFGDFDEQLVFLEARLPFPAELEEGMIFEGSALPDGTGANMPADKIFTVTDVYPEHVVLDGNHPLAGIAMRLTLEIADVREGSQAEMDAGTLGTGFFKLERSLPGKGTLH